MGRMAIPSLKLFAEVFGALTAVRNGSIAPILIFDVVLASAKHDMMGLKRVDDPKKHILSSRVPE